MKNRNDMKKTLFAIAISVMALSSCAGSKTEKSDEANNDAVQVEQEQAGSKLTAEQKNAFVASGLVSEADFSKPVFVDFNATWCGPCRQFGPYFEAAAEKYSDRAKFVAVDVDVYGEVANAFGVQSIPMVLAILPNGEYTTYIGTQDIVGDGVFDAIVEKFTK